MGVQPSKLAGGVRITERDVEHGARRPAGDEKDDRTSNRQPEIVPLSDEDLTRGIREAIDNGDGNELQTLLDGASDTDRERVLLEPYGESGTGLHVGTTPLLHAARCTQPEAFGGLLRASHPKKVVEMLTAKDKLGHTILAAAVLSQSEETCKAVFNVAQEYLHQEQLWQLIESIDTNGGTLLSAAVQSGSKGVFEAALDYVLGSLGHHQLCALMEHANNVGHALNTAPYDFSRKLWSILVESGHFGFFESVTRVVPSAHRYQLLQVGDTSPLSLALDYGLLKRLDACYMNGHKVADEPCSQVDEILAISVQHLLYASPDHVDSGFEILSFLMAGSARPSASDLKRLCQKSRTALKYCCLRAVTSAANPFIPGLVLSIRLAEATKEANEGDQRSIDDIRTSVEALLLEIFERLPRTVREFDEEMKGGCAGMFEPQVVGGHQSLGLERPLDMILSGQEQMKTFCNVPLVMDFLSQRFARGLPNLQDTEGVSRNSEDLEYLGAGLVLGEGIDDPGACQCHDIWRYLLEPRTLLQAAYAGIPNLVFFPGAQFVVAGVAARPNSYYRVPAMRMLLDFVAYVAMIGALGYFVLFHSTIEGVLGDDGIYDGELTWGEGSFAVIFISAGVFREGREMWKDIDKYFKDQWNVLDALALLCLSIGLVIRGADWTSPWGPAFYALSAPLLVSRVLFFAQVLPFQGPMIKVIFRMTTTLLRFGFVMVTIMIGFAMALHVLFHDLDSFGATFLDLFRAMLGEVDFFQTFAGGRYDSVATVLLVVYLVVVTILLLNLLVAILSTSHAEVRDNVKLEVKVSKARVVEHYQWTVEQHLLPAPFNLLQLALSVAVSTLVLLCWLVFIMPQRMNTWKEGWEQTKGAYARVRRVCGQFVFWLVLGLVTVAVGAVLWMVSGLPIFPYAQFAWYKQYKAETLKHNHNWFLVRLTWRSIFGRWVVILLWCVVGAPVSLFVLWLAAIVQVLGDCFHADDEEPNTVERPAIERLLMEGDAGVSADKLREFLEDPMDDERVRQDEKDRRATVEHVKLLRNRLEKTTKIEIQSLNERLNNRMTSLERLVKDALEHMPVAAGTCNG